MEMKLNPIENILLQPVKYYNDLKGKNIRKSICNILGLYLGVDKKDIDNIDEIITVVHNASLVIDDIQDNSTLRRNYECAHIKYGIPLSINAGYLTIFKLLTEINKKNDISDAVKYKMIENIYYTHIGQGMDIYYTQHKIIPTMEEYNTMVHYKTGMLFVTIIDMLMEKTKNVIVKNNYTTLLKCVSDFSLFFQIRDDYINLCDVNYWKERGFCQDFDEQKISYIIAYCTNHKLANYETINEWLKLPNKTKEDKANILRLMYENGVLDMTYHLLVQLRKQVLEVLNIEMIFEQLPFEKFDESNLLPV
jgi:geranylgeranyl pyrophosphate synthase